MRNAFLVASREYGENARTKGFWISLLMFPVLLVMSVKVPEFLQEKAKPVIEKLFKYFEDQKENILPKSPFGKAVTYVINQRGALEQYLEDGDLHIDNNAAENILRSVALGRKNWMFFGSNAGGSTAAVLYSIVESAELHGLDPLAYLTDVLSRIRTTPRDKMRDLLPDRWKLIKAAAAQAN